MGWISEFQSHQLLAVWQVRTNEVLSCVIFNIVESWSSGLNLTHVNRIFFSIIIVFIRETIIDLSISLLTSFTNIATKQKFPNKKVIISGNFYSASPNFSYCFAFANFYSRNVNYILQFTFFFPPLDANIICNSTFSKVYLNCRVYCSIFIVTIIQFVLFRSSNFSRPQIFDIAEMKRFADTVHDFN